MVVHADLILWLNLNAEAADTACLPFLLVTTFGPCAEHFDTTKSVAMRNAGVRKSTPPLPNGFIIVVGCVQKVDIQYILLAMSGDFKFTNFFLLFVLRSG